MIKGIIWDIDGVILDSEGLHAEVESETARNFGININPDDVIKLYSGVHIEEEFEDMARRFSVDMPLDRALAIRREILERHIQEGVPTVPHAEEVLFSLTAQYKLGFVTSSERYFIEPALRGVGLLKLFEAQVYGDEIEHPKPDPEPFLKAASLLGVTPNKTVAVEDSINGFKSAKAAGMLLIARRAEHNRHIDFSLAGYVVEDLREIPRILGELGQISSDRGTFV